MTNESYGPGQDRLARWHTRKTTGLANRASRVPTRHGDPGTREAEARLDRRARRRDDAPARRPERRQGQDPWNPDPSVDRPRRISDDLAWFRQAVEEPSDHGLQALDESAAVAAWESDSPALTRLRDRGVLDAAGFLLHEPDRSPL